MPRPVRPIADGLVYHVINRGNGRRNVFLREGDYLVFLKAIAEWKERKPFDRFGDCLMANHVHWLLRPGPGQSAIRPRGRPATHATKPPKGVQSF